MGAWKDLSFGRRRFVATAGAGLGAGALGVPLARPALAAPKPEKLLFMADNAPWHGTMMQDAAPAFQKETGIRVEFTQLPDDALIVRYKSELSAKSSSIDIAQIGTSWVSWMSPHVEDVTQLMANADNPYAADFGWDDIVPSVRQIGNYNGKQIGIPYRLTMAILHYQPEVLKQAGFDKPPATWDELLKTAIAVTKAGEGKRYGLGFCMREGPAMTDQWATFLYSNGGRFYDAKTREIFVNQPPGVEALQYYGDLLAKYKVVVPDAVTWEWDEIIAGGQNDRYGMTVTLAPSGTMLNDPNLSKTGGRWAWTVAPGAHRPDQSRTFLSGWSLGVPSYSKNKEWAFAFIQFIAGRYWSLRSMEKGNSPARLSVLQNPEIGKKYGWPPAAAQAIRTAITSPQDPLYGAMELALRPGISRVVMGESDAKSALDQVAGNWQRIFRRGASL